MLLPALLAVPAVWSAPDLLTAVLLAVVAAGLALFLSARWRWSVPRKSAAGSDPTGHASLAGDDRLAAALTRMSRLTSLALVLASLALLGSAALVGLRVADGHDPAADSAAAVATPPTIGALGRGTATLVPDSAAVVVGLEGTWPTVLEATQRVDAAVEAALTAGADPADVRTIAYRVTPIQSLGATGTPTTVQAIQLNYRVALVVRDLAHLDAVVTAATTAGVSVFGVGVGTTDPSSRVAEARSRAVTDALTRAQQIASGLGVTILHADATEEVVANVPASPLALAVADPSVPPPSATGEVVIEVFIRFAVS